MTPPSYEEQTAAVWYAAFCEAWWALSDDDPPALTDIAGDDQGEDPAGVANEHYRASITIEEPGFFDRYTSGKWDF